MRVISGSAKRLQLNTLEGLDTRPTTDRIKETLFNMIAPAIYDSTFLDLFSGSGGIGIEALSRGAHEAVFVENNTKAMDCIKKNLAITKLETRALTMTSDAVSALKRLENEKDFDFIFMDPPYNKNLEKDVLIYLSRSRLVYDCTTIIVEASIETDFTYINKLGFTCIKEKLYKTNKHIFIKKAGKDKLC